MAPPPVVVEKLYELLQYLVPVTAKFPRAQRYLLGERLESHCCDLLELLLGAAYSRDRLGLLQQANIKVAQARYYVRLCKDLRLINLHGYEVLSRMLYDVGRQIGAWSKQQRQQHAPA